MLPDPLINWFEANVTHVTVLAALLVTVISLLLPQLISVRLRKYLEKTIDKKEVSGKN